MDEICLQESTKSINFVFTRATAPSRALSVIPHVQTSSSSTANWKNQNKEQNQ